MFTNRQFPRHFVETSIEVRKVDASNPSFGQMKDISVGGLAFESETEWEIGTIIDIHILAASTFSVFGKIVWCKKILARYKVGVQFMEKDEHETIPRQRMIDELCELQTHKATLYLP